MLIPRRFRAPSRLLAAAVTAVLAVTFLPTGAPAAAIPDDPPVERPAAAQAEPAGPRDYFYDAAGQLAGVSDPAAGAAAYRYDDAGNLLETKRLAAGDLSVFALVPARGPIGTPVEVSGVGFASTAAGNQVTVDGVAATVTAATANRLTVTIPAGATDGVLQVTANGKTARAERPFRVEGGTPAPAITALSADRGNRNDLVTITGTGFDADKTRNVVMFHRTVAQVQTASATSLTVRVPAAASSGRVTVRTPGGTATSAADFLVAPRGFVMNNLVYGGRLKAGQPAVTVTVPAGKQALVLLDGVAGESVNLRFEGNTVPVRSALWLFTPHGGNFARGTLGDPLDLWAGNTLSQDLPKLTTTGTYAMVIKPNDDAAGQVKITASNTLTGNALTADGSGVPFQVTVAQQAVELPFQATANQWLSLGMTDISEPANTLVVRATAPDGTYYSWSSPLTQYTPTMIFKPTVSGTWKLSLTWGANQLGFGRVWLSKVVEGGTLGINGATATANITRPGQSVRLPFTGTTGQRLQLGFSENTLQANDRPQYPSTIMTQPNGNQVELRAGYAETRDIPVLTQTGQHAIFVTGWLAVGSVKAWLSSPNEAGLIAPSTKKTVTIDRPGRDAWLDYDGVAGRPLWLTTTDKSLPGEVYLRIYRPNGSLLHSGRTVDVASLPDTGRYRIQVDPETPGTGTVGVIAAEPRNLGTLAVDGPALAPGALLPGQKATATFTGAAGQRLAFSAQGDIQWMNSRILKPDKTVLDSQFGLDFRLGRDIPALPVAGVYTIELTPYQQASGSVGMQLYGEHDNGTITIGAPAKTVSFPKPAQNGRVTFDAVAGDLLELEVAGSLWSYLSYQSIYEPAGTALLTRTAITRRITSLPTVRATGTHTFVFDFTSNTPGGLPGDGQITLRRRASAAAAQAQSRNLSETPAAAPACATPAETITGLSAPAPEQGGVRGADPRQGETAPLPGCESPGWKPDARNLGGEDWSTRREAAPTRERALQFPVGVTGVAGRVLDVNDRPLKGVTVGAAGRKATTDADGFFALTGVPGGHLSMRVDGRSTGQHGVFDIGVEVARGEVLVLPYTVFLPKLDAANTVTVKSPTAKEVVLTTKAIPGLEVRIPAGTVIRDADGNVTDEINLTPIPVDRSPFPLPPTKVPVYFTVQPGGGVLFPEGATIIYPNYTHEPPGTRTHFWNYDPDGKGWHIYGLGRVSPDGKQIIPDDDVRFYRLTGAMTAVPGLNPARLAPRSNGTRVGDPVDPATGLLVDEMVDLTINDVVPIEIKRTYQQGDTDTRSFGVGTNFDYGMFPWSPGQIGNFDFQQFDLVQPDGSKVHYTRTSPGNDYAGAVFSADPTPTAYAGSIVRWNGDGWDVVMRDGTVFVLGDEAPIQEIRDKFGNTTTITRATSAPGTDGKVRQNGAITQITSPNGRWVKFGYDQGNPPKVTSIEDNLGRKVAYTYDATNHLRTVTGVTGGVTEYTWNSTGLLESIKDPRGTTYLVNTYDAAGRVKTQKAADGGLTTFDYVDVNGVITQTTLTDARGNLRRFTFNAQGSVLTDVRGHGTALAQTTTHEYDASGVVRMATVDPGGRRTAYGYDGRGQVNALTVLAGTTGARTERYEYNGPYGELTKETDAYGKSTVYELDTRGAVKAITDRMNRRTQFTVDGSGQVTSITDPAGKVTRTDLIGSDPVTVTDALGRVTRFAYDAAGRVIRTVDARGGVTDHVFDAADQNRSTTDQLGRTTTYEFDANGNLTDVVDPRQHRTVLGYTLMDQVERVTDPTGAVETYEYDRNGNPKKLTSRRGVATEHDYDALDRRTTTRIGTEATIIFGYDTLDRLRRTEDSVSGVTTTDYDDLDRITAEGTPQGTVTYAYGTTTRDRTMTTTGAPATRYVYDANGDLAEVQQGGTTVTSIGRDTAGRPGRVGAPSGVSQTYAYNDAGEVTSITYRAGTTVLGDIGYQYDATGQAIRTTGGYSRTQLPAAFGPAEYDEANRITSVAGTALTYDADGNLTSDGTTTYTWNARGELAGLSRTGLTATFGYTTDGRRLGRTVNGTETNYVYDGPNPLLEKAGGAVTATMTSSGVDGFHTRQTSAGTKRYLTDATGSTLALVDNAGAGAQYSYDPYGTTTVAGNDDGNRYRYTGREDDGTGLYYYRNRYYSPVLQRFISEDPAGLDGGGNLYAYAANQPMGFTDPMGTKPTSSRNCLDNSFTPETGIRMADGSVKRIEDVRNGDRVLATDPETGRTEAATVSATITGEGEKHLVDVSVDTDGDGIADDTVTATDEHPFWVADPGAWRAAQDLRAGDLLRTGSGTYVQVTAIAERTATQRVHNLTVDGLHTYYVSVAGQSVLVHNCAEFVRNQALPKNGGPWKAYQEHVTGRSHEEVWRVNGRITQVDGGPKPIVVEAKWMGRDNAAYLKSPYHPSNFFNETKFVDQARRLLQLNQELKGNGVRYAVSNPDAANFTRALLREWFPEQMANGTLKVYHVPGNGMRGFKP